MTREPVQARGPAARVTLRMRGTVANASVLEVATVVARAFHAELLGLFVEDERLTALATLPFAREISQAGARPLSPELVRREMHAAAVDMERRFQRVARSIAVPARFVSLVGDQLSSLGAMMAEAGILVVGEPLALTSTRDLDELLADASGISGVVVSGPRARRVAGPVLVVVSSPEHVDAVAGAASRVAAERGAAIDIAVVGDDPELVGELERTTLAHLVGGRGAHVLHLHHMTPGMLATLVARHGSGLVVGALHGVLAADAASATRFACAVDCPMLLMS